MAEVITAKDLVIPAQAQAGGMMNDIKDLNDFVKNISQVMQQMAQLKGQYQGIAGTKQETPVLTSHAPNLPSTKEVYIPMEIDQKKVKAMLYDLLTVQAPKLPPDIQEYKIKDIIGENWDKLKINIMGSEINSSQLMEAISIQLTEQIKRCSK